MNEKEERNGKYGKRKIASKLKKLQSKKVGISRTREREKVGNMKRESLCAIERERVEKRK